MRQKIIKFFENNPKFALGGDFVFKNKQSLIPILCRKCGDRAHKRWAYIRYNYGCPKCGNSDNKKIRLLKPKAK